MTATAPGLIDKAQAAVERAAHQAVSVVSGSLVERRGEDVSGEKASGFAPTRE